MFKKIMTMSAVLLTFCGCTAKENISNPTVLTAKTTSYAIDDSESYTVEDLKVLQDFLLGRRTDSNGKDFDLCKDGRLDVFDMCLLRSEVIKDMQKNPDSDILVTYFSCTGNTEQIAEYAIDYLQADSYEIIPEIPYTEDDLKYYTDCRADREQNDPTARPEISGSIENIDDYEVIFVGYPIWHGQAPKIIYTFLESYDFSDKIIVPFCTSHSSGIGTSAENLHSLTEDTTWYDGMRFSGNSIEADVTKWIDSLNLNLKEEISVAEFDLESGKNQHAPTVTLNSGYQMPIAGIGTYSLKGNTCVNSVKSALSQGVRLIDTAYMYGNEKEVGQAIRESGIPREDIFVITKIYPGEQFKNPEKAIQDALDKLDIDYIDMMLLHH
ncbi:MAG: aldo/keto reductase, partial [Prevotella sp.]|nr:aldo/keto reductase [Prevotella sp.]